jgi:cell filamentation protein
LKRSNKFPPVFEDKLSGLPESEREIFGRELSDARADELDINPIKGDFDIEHLSKIHKYLFQDSSTHAGVVRGYDMNKGGIPFADSQQMDYLFDRELPLRVETLGLSVNDVNKYIDAMTDLHSTLDLAHPFREGNGRSTRIFMSQLSETHGYTLDYSMVNAKEWVEACIDSINTGREDLKRPLFERIITPLKYK